MYNSEIEIEIHLCPSGKRFEWRYWCDFIWATTMIWREQLSKWGEGESGCMKINLRVNLKNKLDFCINFNLFELKRFLNEMNWDEIVFIIIIIITNLFLYRGWLLENCSNAQHCGTCLICSMYGWDRRFCMKLNIIYTESKSKVLSGFKFQNFRGSRKQYQRDTWEQREHLHT